MVPVSVFERIRSRKIFVYVSVARTLTNIIIYTDQSLLKNENSRRTILWMHVRSICVLVSSVKPMPSLRAMSWQSPSIFLTVDLYIIVFAYLGSEENKKISIEILGQLEFAMPNLSVKHKCYHYIKYLSMSTINFTGCISLFFRLAPTEQ